MTNFIGGTEYALYKRIDRYFVLIDFFECYEEANQEARDVINKNQKLRILFHIN